MENKSVKWFSVFTINKTYLKCQSHNHEKLVKSEPKLRSQALKRNFMQKICHCEVSLRIEILKILNIRSVTLFGPQKVRKKTDSYQNDEKIIQSCKGHIQLRFRKENINVKLNIQILNQVDGKVQYSLSKIVYTRTQFIKLNIVKCVLFSFK